MSFLSHISSKSVLSLASVAIQTLGLAYVVEKHIYFRKGTGLSMYPTFYPHDLFLVESMSYSYFARPLKIGDIVVFSSPANGRDLCMKRITALDGDRIRPDESFEYNYGDEEYYRIPTGHIWVEGDNKSESLDSRTYGPVSLNLIKYRLAFRIGWPFQWGYDPTKVTNRKYQN